MIIAAANSMTEKSDSKSKVERKRSGVKGPKLNESSREARKVATAILEVMAGTRLPSDAAKALGISQPRYYLLESRALNGLIAGCEPRPIGRVRSVKNELATAQSKVKRLEQDCARYAALARVAQRTIGLATPLPSKPAENGKKQRKRKPTVRALKAVGVLKSMVSGEAEAGSAGEQPAKE